MRHANKTLVKECFFPSFSFFCFILDLKFLHELILISHSVSLRRYFLKTVSLCCSRKQNFEWTFQIECIFVMHSKGRAEERRKFIKRSFDPYFYLQQLSWFHCTKIFFPFQSFCWSHSWCANILQHSFEGIMIMEKFFSISTYD